MSDPRVYDPFGRNGHADFECSCGYKCALVFMQQHLNTHSDNHAETTGLIVRGQYHCADCNYTYVSPFDLQKHLDTRNHHDARGLQLPTRPHYKSDWYIGSWWQISDTQEILKSPGGLPLLTSEKDYYALYDRRVEEPLRYPCLMFREYVDGHRGDDDYWVVKYIYIEDMVFFLTQTMGNV